MKYRKNHLVKSNKRGSTKSPTSKIEDWNPKTGKPFRETKRSGTGVRFPTLNRPYP